MPKKCMRNLARKKISRVRLFCMMREIFFACYRRVGRLNSCQSYSCPFSSATAMWIVILSSLIRFPAFIFAVYFMPLCGNICSTMIEGDTYIFFISVLTTGTMPYTVSLLLFIISKITRLLSPDSITWSRVSSMKRMLCMLRFSMPVDWLGA